MRRVLLQFLSIPSALVVGLFHYAGSYAFRGTEQVFATIVVIYCAVLLALAIANFFSERLFRLHFVFAVGLAMIVAGAVVYVNVLPKAF